MKNTRNERLLRFKKDLADLQKSKDLAAISGNNHLLIMLMKHEEIVEHHIKLLS